MISCTDLPLSFATSSARFKDFNPLIVAFTTLPLSISTLLGTIFSIIAFIYMVFIIAKNLLYSDPVQGFATIMCAILLLGGIQLLSIGILGKYLEKTYAETKNRPIFIVKESNIDDE